MYKRHLASVFLLTSSLAHADVNFVSLRTQCVDRPEQRGSLQELALAMREEIDIYAGAGSHELNVRTNRYPSVITVEGDPSDYVSPPGRFTATGPVGGVPLQTTTRPISFLNDSDAPVDLRLTVHGEPLRTGVHSPLTNPVTDAITFNQPKDVRFDLKVWPPVRIRSLRVLNSRLIKSNGDNITVEARLNYRPKDTITQLRIEQPRLRFGNRVLDMPTTEFGSDGAMIVRNAPGSSVIRGSFALNIPQNAFNGTPTNTRNGFIAVEIPVSTAFTIPPGQQVFGTRATCGGLVERRATTLKVSANNNVVAPRPKSRVPRELSLPKSKSSSGVQPLPAPKIPKDRMYR